MKIANVVRRFVFEEWGGTESVVWNLSKQFVRDGNNVEVVSTSALCDCAEELRDGIKISRFKYFYPQAASSS